MKTHIKEKRLILQLTQQELAEKVGVRRETIVFLEQGKYNPSLKLAFQISQVLQTPLPELFIFEEKELR